MAVLDPGTNPTDIVFALEICTITWGGGDQLYKSVIIIKFLWYTFVQKATECKLQRRDKGVNSIRLSYPPTSIICSGIG